MNLRQIVKFVAKINYNVTLPVKYFSNKKSTSPVAMVWFIRTLNKDQSVNVLAAVEINKRLKKYLKDTTLKAALVHEVGHLYSGYTIKSKKLKEFCDSMREYEAQVWAIKRTRALKMTNIRRSLINHFLNWSNFNGNNKIGRIYKMAWKIAVKNKIIKPKKD